MSQRLATYATKPAPAVTPEVSGLLQRKCAACGQHGGGGGCSGCGKKKEESLQRRVAGIEGATEIPAIVNEVLHSPGQSLDTATRAFMEPRFHQDFSQVRVHSDAKAAESARAVNAHAYTVGSHVVFGAGQYRPGTKLGNNLLAHELTHVLQQSRGLTRAASGVGPANDEFERQADAVANAVVSTPNKPVDNAIRPLIPGTHQVVATNPAPPPPRRSLQRKEKDPLDEVFDNQIEEPVKDASAEAKPAACPKVPTKRGDDIPTPMCPTATHTGAQELKRFNFCLDSDQLTDPAQINEVDAAVNSVPLSTRFLVHGYASPEGQKSYNFRLACHRAVAIAKAIRASLRKRLDASAPNERMLNAEVESRIETASQGPTSEFGKPEANRVALMFAQVAGKDAPEPGCDKAPRKLGDVKPEIGCDPAKTELDDTGESPQLARFHFCLDSDVLTPETPNDIRTFAHRQAASSTFIIHAFASVEGAADYNQRLSCHRAVRIFRELINAGVLAEQIREVSGLGKTDHFGEPDQNRVAVVFAEGGEVEPIPGGTRGTKNVKEREAVRDEARTRLLSGQYNLGADAYISFWTCGRTATVRQGVERLMIDVSKDSDENRLREKANGTEEGIGFNHVILSNLSLRADNAIECVMGRIVDMAFHHAVLGNRDLPSDLIKPFDPNSRDEELKNPANKEARHKAGLHLIHLAGLGRCQGDRVRPRVRNNEEFGIDVPIKKDPRKDMEPPACAVAPQQTRMHPPAAGTKEREAPTFEVTQPLDFKPLRGKLMSNFDKSDARKSKKRLMTWPETNIFTATAAVKAKGNPETFKDYEVGLIQTVTADEAQADYDSGHSVTQRLPVPIRMAQMRGFPVVPAPWSTLNSMKSPDADGDVALNIGRSGVHTEAEIGLRQIDGSLPNSGIQSFEQDTQVSMWLVVRRLGAPLDRFAIRFLDGLSYNLLQLYHLEHRRIKGDIRQPVTPGLEEKELPVVVGNFLTSKPGLPADPSSARFTNPVAGEIDMRNTVQAISQPRAPQANDLGPDEVKKVVMDILDNLVVFEDEAKARKNEGGVKMPRVGFDFAEMDIILPIVRATGRLENRIDERIAVRVESPHLGFDAKTVIAEALDFRIRDLGGAGKPMIVRPNAIPGTNETGDVVVHLDPLGRKPGDERPETDMVKRQEVLDDMAEAWACTLATGERIKQFFGAREFGRSYAMTRDRELLPAPSDRLVMGEESIDEGHKLKMPCARRSDAVTLGGFHTHPKVQIPPVPSQDDDEGDDLDFAKGCGFQAFIVTDFKAFRYFPDGRVDPNPTQLAKVNKCDAKHVQENNVVDPSKPKDEFE